MSAAPPFRETIYNATNLYANSNYWPVELEHELLTPVQMNTRELFQLGSIPNSRPIGYGEKSYTDSRQLRRNFNTWAAKGKYPYLVAAFYALQSPSGRQLHKVSPAAAFDYEHYLKLQHALMYAYVQYQLSGQLPMQGQ